MPGAVMYLVGSKLDKAASSRAVKYEEGQALAARHGAGFCEVSSKTRENVRNPFVDIVDEIVKKPELLSGSRRSGGINMTGSNESMGYGCSC